jgi:hypothetical protein
MQYRSGWASKHNQEVILAIFLKRDAFEKILELAQEAPSFNERQERKGKGMGKGRRPSNKSRRQEEEEEEEEEEEVALTREIQVGDDIKTDSASSTSSSSSSSSLKKDTNKKRHRKGSVRLQWDPDHNPDGSRGKPFSPPFSFVLTFVSCPDFLFLVFLFYFSFFPPFDFLTLPLPLHSSQKKSDSAGAEATSGFHRRGLDS